jgi:8-oxo-dGTP pyrophosphatase MutT (NUDIX family)
MNFYAVEPTPTNAPWLLRDRRRRSLTLQDVEARLRDLPPARLIASFTDVLEPKASAILVPVGAIDGEAAVVVTRRPDTMSHHGAMWVFPGGRFDLGVDHTTTDTAVREAREELGLSTVRITAQLNSHGPISSGFLVDVFVGVVDPGSMAPDPHGPLLSLEAAPPPFDRQLL